MENNLDIIFTYIAVLGLLAGLLGSFLHYIVFGK